MKRAASRERAAEWRFDELRLSEAAAAAAHGPQSLSPQGARAKASGVTRTEEGDGHVNLAHIYFQYASCYGH